MHKRSVVRTLLLLAATLAGLLLVPASPASAAQYANCTNAIDSGYNWRQSSCIWNENGTIYGNTGVDFLPNFNHANVNSCTAVLELWDNTTNVYITRYEYPCTAVALSGATHWVPGRHVWLVSSATHYRQYAYMVVTTGAGTYDSRNTTCALRYYPEGTGQTGC